MLKKLLEEYKFSKAGKIYIDENNRVNYLIDIPELSRKWKQQKKYLVKSIVK